MPYHMRRSEREISDKSRMSDILKAGRYAILALSGKNLPYVVTLSYGFDEAGNALYFHCAKEGKKIDFLKENNRACLTVIEDKGYVQDQCEHRYRSLVITGRICFVTDPEEKMKGIEVLLSHYRESREGMMKKIRKNSQIWQDTQILRFDIEEMTGKERGF